MNKILTVFIFLFVTATQSFSQSSNVQSAANYLKFNDLKKAKEAIDAAAKDPSTSGDYKMWYYMGKVYWAIYTDSIAANRDIDKDAAEKAAIGYLNYHKTVPKKWFEEEATEMMMRTGVGVYNEGTKLINSKEYDKALSKYNLIFELIPYDKNKILPRNNVTPEVIYYNIYLIKYFNNDLIGAKEYLLKLIDANFNDPLIYISMARISMVEKDTAKGLNFIELGRKRFDDNSDLIKEELSIYVKQGKMDVLIEKLNIAIETKGNDEMLYLNRGTLYSQNNDFVKAKSDYLKALEINPDYFEGLTQLGTLYFNQAAEINTQMSNLDVSKQKEYDELKKQRDELLKEATPHFEKANEINPKHKETLLALRQIYALTGNLEKANEVKIKLEELNNKK